MPSTPETAERFDALYQWLSRRYRLKQSEFRFNGRSLIFFKIEDVDRVLDEAAASANADEETPYWAELWPSAIALGRFIFENRSFESQTVLELGCGLGFCGLVAGLKGAHPIFSDFREDALRMAELNYLMNFSDSARFLLLDWRRPEIAQRVDVVLASDVAYERRWFWPLLDTFKAVLKPGGAVFLSEPNRPVAREFFQLLKQEKFDLKKLQEVPAEQGGGEISLYRITLPL